MLSRAIYPRMHPFLENGLQGLGMCQYYGVRDVPFEVRTTKEATGQKDPPSVELLLIRQVRGI